jgi:hypothetical protein
MSLATITWSDGVRVPIHDDEMYIAIEAYLLWKGHNPVYDEARATLSHVALPPSWLQHIPATLRPDVNKWQEEASMGLTDNLTHEGRLQGRSEQIPVGDR